jgi:hypothetical protein
MAPMSLSIVGKFVKILQLGFLWAIYKAFFLLLVCKILPPKKKLCLNNVIRGMEEV